MKEKLKELTRIDKAELAVYHKSVKKVVINNNEIKSQNSFKL